MSTPQIAASLRAIATGDVDIRAARAAIRSAMSAGNEMIDAVYAAIRETTFRIVSSRQNDRELAAWYDLSTHAATLARRAERGDVSERLVGFSELIAQTGRFADRQPVEEVLARRHVSELVAAIAAHGGEAPRAAIVDRVGLAEANLSRVLGILSAHGLVSRRRDGKEVHLELTEAGRLAAAKLGHPVEVRTGDRVRWWDALSWPVGVWDADGEPVGMNEAFRSFAEGYACPSPSMVTSSGWDVWLETIVQDSRATDSPAMRDLRIDSDNWARLVEDRLAGGERVVMLIDTSAPMLAQTRLERRLRTAEEEVAALKVQLAEANARLAEERMKLGEAERRLLSFTTWLDFLKGGVVGETGQLANRLQLWLAKLRPGAMRSEAEPAYHQILTLKRAMQALLYTPHWTAERDEPASLIDPQSLISDSVDIVRQLSSSRIDITFDGDDHLKDVLLNENVVRATVGQGILNFVREREANHYYVKSKINKRRLEILCVGFAQPKPSPIRADFDWYHSRVSAGAFIEHGYAHARDVAETIGGTVETGKSQSFVIISLPLGTKPLAKSTIKRPVRALTDG